jgi:hypothetical protein
MITLEFHIPYSKLGDVAKIGNWYFEYKGNDIWAKTKSQKYNF